MRLEDLLRAPFRHWWRVLALWLVIISATVAATALMGRRYRSEGKLVVRLGRENTTLDPTATVGHGNFVALPPSREDEINSVVQILLSRNMAEKVVNDLGVEYVLDKPPNRPVDEPESPAAPLSPSWADELWQRINPLEASPPREMAIKRFQERLKVGAVRKTNVINLTYEASTPQKAQAILNNLIDFYLDQHASLTRSPGSHQFLTTQTQETQQRLTDVEDELRALKNESAVVSVDEQRRILEARMGSLQDKLFDAEAELKQASAEVARLESILESLPGTLVSAKVEGHPNEAADLMRQQLFALELREKELLSKYQEDFFLVKDIRRQITEAKSILNAENDQRTQVTTSLNQIPEHLRLTLLSRRASQAALQAKQEALSGQLEETRLAVTALNDRAVAIARLEREVAIHESGYRKYAENLEQTRLDQALELEHISNVVLAQAPTLEMRIVRPQKLVNYLIGFVLATAASLALAVLSEHFRLARRRAYLDDEIDIPDLAELSNRGAPSSSHSSPIAPEAREIVGRSNGEHDREEEVRPGHPR